MVQKIPKAVEPHFNSIITQANTHPWLVAFYNKEIRQVVRQTIEHKFFGSELFKERYPRATALEKYLVLKEFFLPENRKDPIFDPIRELFKDLQAKQKILQDSWLTAIASRNEVINLNDSLPSYTHEVLREILTREILLYLYRRCKAITARPGDTALNQLWYWLKKELDHLGPVAKPMVLDNERFEKIHDPGHPEWDFGNFLGHAWYFMNGVSRTPLFLQCELLAIKSMISTFREMTYTLAKGGPSFKSNLMVRAPLNILWLLLGVMYLSFIPYRLARTMVNELTGLFRLTLTNISRAIGLQTHDNFYKTMGLALEWLCYLGLLAVFSLPVLPNPFAWTPVFSSAWLMMTGVVLTFASTTMAWMFSLNHYLTQNPILFLRQSVEEVEKQVEKGINAVDKAHKTIFYQEAKGFTPNFDQQSKSGDDAQLDPQSPYPTPTLPMLR